MDRKARIVAVVMADRVGRALDRGIPPDRLEGVNEYFVRVLGNNSDVASIWSRVTWIMVAPSRR